MPIYAYRCTECGHEFDRFFTSHQRMTATRVACPHCASRRVRRLISAPHIKSGGTASSDDGGGEGADDAPTSSSLLGRKEIAQITARRKKAGLPG